MNAAARPDRRPSGAFSLVELIVVLVLMAVLAAIASTSARGALVRQQLSRAAETVERFDTELRRTARRNRVDAVGLIERSRGRLSVRTDEQSVRRFTLPKNVTLVSVRAQAGGRLGTAGRIIATPNGATPSYALQLRCDGIDRWVMIVGGSGQVRSDLERSTVNALLGS